MDKQTVLSHGHYLTAIVEKKPLGLFLCGQFEFGDADGEKLSQIRLDSLEELYAIFRYLSWLDKMNYNTEIDYRVRSRGEKRENDFYAQAGEEWRDKYLWDGVLDWWERDPTNDYPARLGSYWVIFRDETGEYKVILNTERINS